MVKNLPANVGDARDTGFNAGLGKFPGVGDGNPLQYSCLENFMDTGAWQARVHGSESDMTECVCAHTPTNTYSQTLSLSQ